MDGVVLNTILAILSVIPTTLNVLIGLNQKVSFALHVFSVLIGEIIYPLWALTLHCIMLVKSWQGTFDPVKDIPNVFYHDVANNWAKE